MPVSPRDTPSSDPSSVQANTRPDPLRPYIFHGVQLASKGSHAVGDCPFCKHEGKFSVDVVTGLWRCFVCGAGTTSGGGNSLVFLRLLHEQSMVASRPPNNARNALAAANGHTALPPGGTPPDAIAARVGDFWAGVTSDRCLCRPETPEAWGVCQSIIDGDWLVPGYGTDGKLDQLYKRVRVYVKGEWTYQLRPTPGVWPEGKVHALHLPTSDFDPTRPLISICEGPWDGMAMWEVVQPRPDSNVIAVPGCNVWRDEWSEMCRGKHVTLWFDSDHPVPEALAQGRTVRPGYDGMARIAKRLSGIAASVKYIRWGSEGYDESKPSGWDVRDELSQFNTSDKRKTLLTELLTRVEDAPRDWFMPGRSATTAAYSGGRDSSVEALSCSTWAECEAAWKVAMQWRRDLSDALCATLAVCASTNQGGNQLFMDLVGSPGVAKTTVLRGALVSSHCIHVENITKLISGYKMPGESKDCSFIARANGKTWITCEFDTVLSSPQYNELMGKMRRIFDGETSSTYANSDEDRVYNALRTPWIRAGTWKMVEQDQSQLGDRFIRLIIHDPAESEKRSIVRSALRLERSAMLETANGTTSSVLDPKTRMAYSLMGGYIDWLRANVEEKLPAVDVSEEAEDYCIDLAELSADLRARPVTGKRRGAGANEDNHVHSTKELPTRLARQNMRLAVCLAVAQNKTSVDAEVLRIVRKVALDTAHGHSLSIVKWMCSPNPKSTTGDDYQASGGFSEVALAMWCNMTTERMIHYLTFLKNIGVLELTRLQGGRTSWILTDRVYELYQRVTRPS